MSQFSQLAEKIAQRDPQACRALIALLERPLYLFLRQSGVTDADAQDVLQETFVAVWRRIDQLREPDSLRGWIFQICLNAARRRLGSANSNVQENRAALLSAIEGSPVRDHPAERERDEIVRRIVAELDPLHREVIALHYFGGLTIDECAAALEIPPGTVKSRVGRALAEVRARCIAAQLLEERAPCPQL